MSWDSFCNQVKQLTNQAAVKINRAADITALQTKLVAAKHNLETAYTELGKVAYPYFTDKNETQAQQLESCLTKIKLQKQEIATLQAKIKALKETAETQKEGTATSGAADASSGSDCEDPTQPAPDPKPSSADAASAASCGSQPADPSSEKGENDLCMDVTITSRSADCEGAITLNWNED